MNSRKMSRDGFSLVEVLLALAILTGAVAILGELVRQGSENAKAARDLTKAELLCESKLAELTAGLAPLEALNDATFDYDDLEGWLYSVELQTLEVTGLVEVRVTVRRDLPPQKKPVEFSLVRWISVPEAE